MRSPYLVLVLLISGCAAGSNTAQSKTTYITNYESPGNLQARADIGCLKVAELQSTYTAADLYRSNAVCVKQNDLDSAVYSSALAGFAGG